MRIIYVDEAGISAPEPVTVVVGIIVNADRHWLLARAQVEAAFDCLVPAKRRPGFHFHAKAIFGERGDSSDWPLERRLELVQRVAPIPRHIGMAFSAGKVRRDAPRLDWGKNIRQEHIQHAMALAYCLARADTYLRKYAAPYEVATVVVENTPKMRGHIKMVFDHLKRPELFPAPPNSIRPTLAELAAGKITQEITMKITRIIDTPLFAEKMDAPLLQIADACAFSFRRYFAAQNYGDMLVRTMVGSDLIWEDWQGPASMEFFCNPAEALQPGAI